MYKKSVNRILLNTLYDDVPVFDVFIHNNQFEFIVCGEKMLNTTTSSSFIRENNAQKSDQR